MRVCELMAGDGEGGLETHFAELCNALARGGDEVVAVAHERYRDRLSAGVGFTPLDLTRGRRNPLLRRRLRRVLGACGADLIHAHGGKAAAILAAVGSPCATVGTVHALKRDLSAYRGFDAVIGVSAGVLAGFDHRRARVIPNGVHDPPRPLAKAALRRRFAVAAGQTVTVAVGRLVPVKGFAALIEMWDGGNGDLGHLLVLGDGPERRRLARLAQGKPVTLAGFQADAWAVMAAADLVVCASEREGFSYALAEALRVRAPVVSTPVPGAVGLLPPEHLGRGAALKRAIARALADPAAAQGRLAQAFAWAAETLTAERMVRDTRQVYVEVLGGESIAAPDRGPRAC